MRTQFCNKSLGSVSIKMHPLKTIVWEYAFAHQDIDEIQIAFIYDSWNGHVKIDDVRNIYLQIEFVNFDIF